MNVKSLTRRMREDNCEKFGKRKTKQNEERDDEE